MALSIGELTGYLDLDKSRFKRGVDGAKKDLDSLRYHMGNTTIRISDKFSRDILIVSNSFGTLSQAAIRFSMLTAKAFLAIPVLSHVVASVYSLVGALGVVPAVAGAAYLAIKTLKIGFDGFGEAMKNIRDIDKFNEAIKDMPPPMQDTAKAVRSLLPQWDALKKNVQTALFKDVADDVKKLGGKYMPILERSMIGTANGFNQAFQSTSKFLSNEKTVKDMGGAFQNMTGFTNSLAASLRPIVQIITDLVIVGSEFLPGMGQAFANGATNAAKFVREARETGKLKEWIREGIDALKALVGAIINVGKFFSAVFDAVGISGDNTLQMIERITARMVEWARSAEGQEKIRTLFEGIMNVASALAAVLPHLGDALMTILGAFSALPAPVQSLIGSFIGWMAVIGFVVGKGLALGMALKMLVPALGRLATAVLTKVIPAMLRMIMTMAVTIAKVTIMAAVFVAKTLWMATTVTARIILMVAIWIAQLTLLAAVAIAHAIRIAVVTVAQFAWMAAQAVAKAVWMAVTVGAQFIAMAATAIARTIATAAVVVAQWAIMAAGAMAKAAIMAAAWFIALGPIGWVIAAIIGLVALIIANWDTIKRWTQQAWDFVWRKVQEAMDFVKRKVQEGVDKVKSILAWFNDLPGMFSRWWDGAKTAAITKLVELVHYLQGAGGRFMAALGNLGSLLVGAGRDLVNGLWNGIAAGWSWLIGKVRGLANDLKNAAMSALGIGSPSKVFRDEVGQWIPKGMAVGIDAHADAVRKAVDDLIASLPAVDMDKIGIGRSAMAMAGAGARAAGVHIENFHVKGPVSERKLAEEIDWLGRGRGA